MERESSHISISSAYDDETFNVSINSEEFIKITNRLFDIINGILVFILILFLIADQYNYNFFPFEIDKAFSWWYQIAQIFFILSYWTTDILILRILIICGYILFIIAFRSSIAIDFLIYSTVAILINLQNIFELLYKKRPIMFDEYREKIYKELFINFMNRDEFSILSKNSLLRDLQPNAFYCHQGDKCNSLSILVFGKLQIIKINDESQIFIQENEFIDSAEWILRQQSHSNKGKRFKYSVKAIEKCKMIYWPREILLEQLNNKPDLEAKLLGALGLDVSHKVFNNNSFIQETE